VADLDLDSVINSAIKQLGLALDKKMRSNLKSTIVSELKVNLARGGEAFKIALLAQYDKLASEGYGSKSQNKDPLSLSEFRGLFISQLDNAVKSIKFEGNTITLSVGDFSEWGLDGNQEAPLYFLSYYIEGNIGEWGFLPVEIHNLGHRERDGGGHHGAGFMISKEDYENERWHSKTGVPFSDIKHPLSGRPPFRGFNQAAESFDWSPYVCKAVEDAFIKIFQ
jgi:hypothetical protein